MHIVVKRFLSSTLTTISEAFIDDARECFILEDVVREKFVNDEWTWKPEFKLKSQTAIPSGTYEVVIDWSNRFQRDTPHLLRVPDFVGVRIHPGNTDRNTEGCLLPGQVYGIDYIARSRLAYEALFDKIKNAIDHGRKVDIEIINSFQK